MLQSKLCAVRRARLGVARGLGPPGQAVGGGKGWSCPFVGGFVIMAARVRSFPAAAS